MLHNPGSVGIGTVVAAFLVGTVLGWINKFFGAVLYLLEYALDLNIHPDISIKILTPAKTDTGYIARAARGISIARRVSAPAGGRYILNE